MLEMRFDCERCGRDLPPNSREARICSFERTFYAARAEGALAGVCPNCGRTLRSSPTWATHLLERCPASEEGKGS